jgi:nickel-dependent lactate racemase
MNEVRFAFGKTGIRLSLPHGPAYEVIESRSASAVPDVHAALDRALDSPVDGPPLRDVASGKKTAAILVCDITRPAPNRLTLPPILQRLHDSGIPTDGITILIATGLHRAATLDEIVSIVGAEIATGYRVLNHDARRADQHRHLGSTVSGTPVYIDERFMAAELHLSLGFIEPHLMLGFSGGRKLVAPGVAGEQTIKCIHSPKFMREPNATEGSIKENPLHAELLEIARMAGHHFILDVTLTHDRQISGAFAGDPVAAHSAGVSFLQQTSLERLKGRADVVITSAAGHPLDLTFYQAVKGVSAAQHLVKPGGKILTIAECSEGIGSPEFADKLMKLESFDQCLEEMTNAAVVIDQWQLEKLAMIGKKNELYFYTPGVNKNQLGCLARNTFGTIDEAIECVLLDQAPGARVIVVPEGPYVFAQVAS